MLGPASSRAGTPGRASPARAPSAASTRRPLRLSGGGSGGSGGGGSGSGASSLRSGVQSRVAASSAPSVSPSTVGTARPVSPPSPNDATKLDLSTLPPYVDSEFSTNAASWSDAIRRKRAMPVLAAGERPRANADGFTPRTAQMLDRSWLLPQRVAKRVARSYQTTAMELSRYQTQQFRDIFGQAAIGEASRKLEKLRTAVADSGGDNMEEGVQVRSHTSADVRPHLAQSASQPVLASSLSRRPSLAHTPLKERSSAFRRTPADRDAETVRPTLVSRRAREHPPESASETTAAMTAGVEVEAKSSSPPPSSPHKALAGSPSGLIFADLTGLKPRLRPLNRATPSGGAAQSTGGPPLSSLDAEEDRRSLLRSNKRTPNGLGGIGSDDDSISDVEIDYDSLLDTDDSDDGLDEVSTGVKMRRHLLRGGGGGGGGGAGAGVGGAKKPYNPSSQYSASMLILSGAQLPTWPHTVESEEEVDEDDDETRPPFSHSEGEDDSQAEAERHRRRKKGPSRVNPYELAAAEEEKALHFLAATADGQDADGHESTSDDDDEGTQDADTVKPRKSAQKDQKVSTDTDSVTEPECFEYGKRVRLTAASRSTVLNASLRGGGLSALDRVAVVHAENLLKRLAKESIRSDRGRAVAHLTEAGIMAHLDAARAEELVKLDRTTRLKIDEKVMPRVLRIGSTRNAASDTLHARNLSDLTPMQQKNLTERELQHFALEEQQSMRVAREDQEAEAAAAAEASSPDSPSKQQLVEKSQALLDVLHEQQAAAAAKVESQLKATIGTKETRPTKKKTTTPAAASKPKPTRPIVDANGHILTHLKPPVDPTSLPESVLGVVSESTDDVRASEPIPLALRPSFSASTLPRGLDRPFPQSRPLPIVAPAHLRPLRALGTQVERWLRKHGQVVRRKLDPTELAKYRAIFSLLDEDASGTLSLSELQVALRDIDVHMTQAELAVMANEIKAESLRTQSMRRRNLLSFDEFTNGLAHAGEWDTLLRLADERKAAAAKQARKAARRAARLEEAAKRRRELHGDDLQPLPPLDSHANPFQPSARPSARPSPMATNQNSPRNMTDGPVATTPVILTDLPSPSPSPPPSSLLNSMRPPALTIPSRNVMRTSRSSVMFRHAPLIGGAGLGIDSLTGASVTINPINLGVDSLQADITPSASPSPPPSHHHHHSSSSIFPTARTATTNASSSASSSAATSARETLAIVLPDGQQLRMRDDSDSTPAVPSHVATGVGIGGKAHVRASSSVATAAATAAAVTANTSDLLPFTLWVPAYSRFKKLASLMSIESVTDAQLQALMEEDESEEATQQRPAFAPTSLTQPTTAGNNRSLRSSSSSTEQQPRAARRATLTSDELSPPEASQHMTAANPEDQGRAAAAVAASSITPKQPEPITSPPAMLREDSLGGSWVPVETASAMPSVPPSELPSLSTTPRPAVSIGATPAFPSSSTAAPRAVGRVASTVAATAGATTDRLAMDPLSSASSQGLPFIWRQTQEAVRIARLQREADKAKAELESLLSGGGDGDAATPGSDSTRGVGGKKAPDALAAFRLHSVARARHQALMRETESKRLTRDLFAPLHARLEERHAAATREAQEAERQRQALAQDMKERDAKKQGTTEARPTKEVLRATRFTAVSQAAASTVTGAAGEAGGDTAAASVSAADPTEPFRALPSLDFLGGARLRASELLDAERRARMLQSLERADQFGAAAPLPSDSSTFDLPSEIAMPSSVSELVSPVTQALAAGEIHAPSVVRTQKEVELDIGAAIRERQRREREAAADPRLRALAEQADAHEAQRRIAEAQTDAIDPPPVVPGDGDDLIDPPLSVSVDYLSIARLWSESALNIEASRRLLREQHRAEAVRLRRSKKKQYAHEARRAYGAHIADQNTSGLLASTTATTNEPNDQEHNDTDGAATANATAANASDDSADDSFDDREQELEWLLFSATSPSKPGTKPRRNSLANEEDETDDAVDD